jgi:hypothetical protein
VVSLLKSPWLRCDELEVALVDYMIFWEVFGFSEQIKSWFASRRLSRANRKARCTGPWRSRLAWPAGRAAVSAAAITTTQTATGAADTHGTELEQPIGRPASLFEWSGAAPCREESRTASLRTPAAACCSVTANIAGAWALALGLAISEPPALFWGRLPTHMHPVEAVDAQR